MITLESSLVDQTEGLAELKELLHPYQFTIGGNWDYGHAYLDRALDEENKIWLRIPIQAEGTGIIEAEYEDEDTSVRMGQPFVLNHLYNDGLDPDAQMSTVSGFVNQFQGPVNPDADVDQVWVDKAKEILNQVEQAWQKHIQKNT